MKADQLMVPVYINEKIVLDMLAIIEDGFSTVSQVSYTEHKDNSNSQKFEAGVSTSATLLSKLLKIDLKGELSHSGNSGENESVAKEKVHTNVSLLSKFRTFLVDEKILKSGFDVTNMKIGDFIEIEGELQKNPLINYMDIFVDLFRMADIFAEKPQLGGKTQAKVQKQQENETVKQIKSFADELKHSGTIDLLSCLILRVQSFCPLKNSICQTITFLKSSVVISKFLEKLSQFARTKQKTLTF